MCNENKSTSKTENDGITLKMELKLDKDFNKLMDMSQKTGVPLIFRGDRIVDFKVVDGSDYDNMKPDLIKIGPPAVYFDLKFGEMTFKHVPFDKLRLTDKILVFKSLFYSKIDINIKIKFKFDDVNEGIYLKITISPKSNKIQDILNYEIKKREFSNKKFEIFLSEDNTYKIEGRFPLNVFNDEELNFYKKVNTINKKLNLNLTLDEDYVITKSDIDCADMICEFINNKKIKIDNVTVNMKTYANMLNEVIKKEKNEASLKQDKYTLNLLGNEINLGSCKVDIKKYEIVNLKELLDIYNLNIDNSDLISFEISLKEYGVDDLYLDFNVD